MNIDTGYLDNPKIDQLLEISQTAVFMHLKSMFYSGEHLTDGHAPGTKIMRLVGGTPEDVQHLLALGLWHDTGHDCEECPQPRRGMIYVHDYLDHNRSKEEAEKQANKAQNAAKARWSEQKNKPSRTPRGEDSNF